MSLLDELLSFKQERVGVECPEWGGKTLYVKRMTTAEKAVWNAQLLGTKSEDCERLILCHTVVDEEGNSVFTPDRMEDMKSLDGLAVTRLANTALEMNKLGRETELKKNSSETTTHDLSSASPSPSEKLSNN